MAKTNESTQFALPATAKKRKSRKRNLRWESLIGPFEAGDYQVVPLTSTNDLREEGELMNHCVGRRYHRWCHIDAVRVFSIRDLDGRRVATASLYFDFDSMRWRIEQCKGYDNTNVCEVFIASEGMTARNELCDIHFLAKYLAALYQRAQENQDGRDQF